MQSLPVPGAGVPNPVSAGRVPRRLWDGASQASRQLPAAAWLVTAPLPALSLCGSVSRVTRFVDTGRGPRGPWWPHLNVFRLRGAGSPDGTAGRGTDSATALRRGVGAARGRSQRSPQGPSVLRAPGPVHLLPRTRRHAPRGIGVFDVSLGAPEAIAPLRKCGGTEAGSGSDAALPQPFRAHRVSPPSSPQMRRQGQASPFRPTGKIARAGESGAESQTPGCSPRGGGPQLGWAPPASSALPLPAPARLILGFQASAPSRAA